MREMGEAVAVVGLDFAACNEAAVDAAVEAAWCCFGHDRLNTLVNCCSYEGEVQDCLSVTEDEYSHTLAANKGDGEVVLGYAVRRFHGMLDPDHRRRERILPKGCGILHELRRCSSARQSKPTFLLQRGMNAHRNPECLHVH